MSSSAYCTWLNGPPCCVCRLRVRNPKEPDSREMIMLNRHSCTTIAIVVAVLVSAATTATARGVRAGVAVTGTTVVDSPDQCAAKLRGNSDWASLILNSGGGWPLYAFASS